MLDVLRVLGALPVDHETHPAALLFAGSPLAAAVGDRAPGDLEGAGHVLDPPQHPLGGLASSRGGLEALDGLEPLLGNLEGGTLTSPREPAVAPERLESRGVPTDLVAQ